MGMPKDSHGQASTGRNISHERTGERERGRVWKPVVEKGRISVGYENSVRQFRMVGTHLDMDTFPIQAGKGPGGDAMNGKTIETICIGDTASFTKTVTEADVCLFAGITGDMNPAHINAEHAQSTPFGERIAHGMLTAGFVSTVIGMHLPGPGTIYLTQDLQFRAPVRIGDTVTATVRVADTVKEKNRVFLETHCTNQRGEKVLTGNAQVMPPVA